MRKRKAKPLTPGERRCLSAIKAIKRKGEHPSLGALCRKLDLKSTNTVRETLDRLERDGWIKRTENQPGVGRTITLTPKASLPTKGRTP